MSFNYGLRPTTHQSLSASGSSVASAAFGSQTEYVRIATPADIHILFGTAPTATFSPGETVAVIGTAEVSVTEMSG